MVFNGIIGHGAVLRLLERSVPHPAPGYLFFGLPHLGKRAVAERFVSALLGSASPDFNPAHPDFIALEREEGKAEISVKFVREARTRAALRPMAAPRRVIYVAEADRLNQEGTNALLKVLEEPPAGASFVFVSEDPSSLPDTLRSRLVPIPFQPVPTQEIADALRSRGYAGRDADDAARRCLGRPGYAITPREDSDGNAVRFLGAASFGERLAILDEVARSCDDAEDSNAAWLAVCDSWTEAFRAALLTDDAADARRVLRAAKGLCGARRCVGTQISPRLPLEQSALHLDLVY